MAFPNDMKEIGLVDGIVLYDQHDHRSNRVWTARVCMIVYFHIQL